MQGNNGHTWFGARTEKGREFHIKGNPNMSPETIETLGSLMDTAYDQFAVPVEAAPPAGTQVHCLVRGDLGSLAFFLLMLALAAAYAVGEFVARLASQAWAKGLDFVQFVLLGESID